MAITALDITQLRNLEQVSIQPKEGLNFIFGPNGSGKSSLLEAIYCLGRAKSFRTHKLDALISTESDHFSVVGSIKNNHLKSTIGIERHLRHSRIRLNGHNVQKATELTEALPIAIIEPGLHRVVEEGPEYRRKFLDWGVFHVEPTFSSSWSAYKRVLQQRNAGLRTGWSKSSISHWDKQLLASALKIDELRKNYISNLNKYVVDVMNHFAGIEGVSLRYYQGWRENIEYREYLDTSTDSDRERGFTQYGPHRADIKFRVGNHEAREYLSRGQQKVFVASLILAQCKLLSETNNEIVILIDDLPAELDELKRSSLLNVLSGIGSQVFITATDQSLFDQKYVAGARVFHVKQGVVRTVV